MPLKITIPCSGEMHTLDVFVDDDDDGRDKDGYFWELIGSDGI